MMTTPSMGCPTLAEAKDFLTLLIEPNGTEVTKLEDEAKAAGLSWASVRRAKDEMGLKSVRKGFAGDGGWVWKK